MKSCIEGVLVALGTPLDSDQPRALVHCTEEQIRSVDRLFMMKPVAIVELEELERLRKIESYRAEDRRAFDWQVHLYDELRRAIDPDGIGDHRSLLAKIAALHATPTKRP